MEEIISITKANINNEEVNAVNGRDLWKKLGSGQEFANWIKGRICEYGFEEGKDFLINLSKSHGRPSKEYLISLDMAKELAMVENNEQGKKIRRYFIEVEKEFRRQSSKNLPPPEVMMATLYTEMERRVKAESERDEYKRNLQRIALASGLDFGETSASTGLPKDIVIPTYCRSSKREHAPQAARYIQLILPLREIMAEYRPLLGEAGI